MFDNITPTFNSLFPVAPEPTITAVVNPDAPIEPVPTPILTTEPNNTLDTENEVEESPLLLFEEIEKITGFRLLEQLGDEVKGKLDNSIPSMVNYIQKFGEQKVNAYEQLLAEKYPKSYQAMLYESKGGNPEDYFKVPSTYSEIKVEKDNTILQEQLILANLKDKGNSEDEAKELLELYKSKGKEEVLKKSQEAHKSLKGKEEIVKNEYMQKVSKEQATQQAVINTFSTNLTNIIKQGELAKFKIPQADSEPFLNYIKGNIEYTADGKFVIVKEIAIDKLKEHLESEYFAFKNGDLKAMIARAAQTQALESLKVNIGTQKIVNGKGGANSNSTQSSLSSILIGGKNNKTA